MFGVKRATECNKEPASHAGDQSDHGRHPQEVTVASVSMDTEVGCRSGDVPARDAGRDKSTHWRHAFEKLAALEKDVGQIREVVISTAQTVSEHERSDLALEQIAAQHRQLVERFYEREVLGVVFQSLIRVADGARELQQRLEREIKNSIQVEHYGLITPLTDMRSCAQMAVSDVDATLALWGVARRETCSERFDPSVQECCERVPTENPDLHGHIAARVRTGYWRDDVPIRPERVRIFVCASTYNAGQPNNHER